MKRLGHALTGLTFFAGGVYMYGEGMLSGIEDFSKPQETQTVETLGYLIGSAAMFIVAGREGLHYVDMGKDGSSADERDCENNVLE